VLGFSWSDMREGSYDAAVTSRDAVSFPIPGPRGSY
jgi:hypothetical protein